MNVEIGAEAALFPEKEYISGILVAVECLSSLCAAHHSKLHNRGGGGGVNPKKDDSKKAWASPQHIFL